MNKSKKFIIGGGVSGLTFAFYHPEYTIITPDVGGLFASAYIAILHDTTETRHFLKDLGYKNVDNLNRKSYIGYYNAGWISDYATKATKTLAIQKKMTDWDKPVDKNFTPESFDMSTSTSTNYLKVLDIEPKEIIEKLSANIGNIIEGKVVSISDTDVLVEASDGTQTHIQYDSLVSTIGAPIFWKLYGQPREFPCKPITNIITNECPPLFNDNYDIIYYDDSVLYSRITHLQESYAIEITGNMTDDQIREHFPTTPVKVVVRVPYGRISNVKDNAPPNDKITFLGRFAEWKYGVVLETVLRRTLEFNSKPMVDGDNLLENEILI